MVPAPPRGRAEEEDNFEAPAALHRCFDQGRRDVRRVEARDPDFVPSDSSSHSGSSSSSAGSSSASPSRGSRGAKQKVSQGSASSAPPSRGSRGTQQKVSHGSTQKGTLPCAVRHVGGQQCQSWAGQTEVHQRTPAAPIKEVGSIMRSFSWYFGVFIVLYLSRLLCWCSGLRGGLWVVVASL